MIDEAKLIKYEQRLTRDEYQIANNNCIINTVYYYVSGMCLSCILMVQAVCNFVFFQTLKLYNMLFAGVMSSTKLS